MAQTEETPPLTLVFIGDDGTPRYLGTIRHKDQWWLVSSWLEHPATRETIPERIVLMDGVRVRFQEIQGQPYRFVLSNALPTAVFYGTSQDGYTVEVHPAALAQSRGPSGIH